jgi:O6-methylguanine-DNA--protein-cysteine methyltransferase
MSSKQTFWVAKIPASLIGPLWVAISEHGLAAIEFNASQETLTRHLLRRFHAADIQLDETRTAEARRQISEYLAEQRQVFDLAIDLSGLSAFQQQALRLTAAIPYGQTVTYQEIAWQMEKPRAAALSAALEATNPLPLVIPATV